MATRPMSWLPRLGPRRGLADLALALVIVSVVGLMIVPLPTWLLDLLLSANLTASISLLLITLYVPDALRVAAFPTLLLLTTLVRLALNVSSTRLILLQADAGHVIRAFGEFVVAGNYVVGGVVFAILSIIQLVVIAKGSERVAEVGARFTLDAMPGKQLAIDAELRAGTLDAEEARRLRRALDRASQFYGAMDGAMKFVRGDVIASFIIIAVNIGGGLAIGMLQRDMTFGDAARVYGLLTIGDGLVTQLPALLIATAAGVLVTRVASETGATALGEDLMTQLLGAPRALRASSLFVAALAFVPGLPLVPFLVMGGALLGISVVAARREPAPALSAEGDGAMPFVPALVPWSLAVSADLARLTEAPANRPGIPRAIETVRDQLFATLGVPLPPAAIRVESSLPAETAVLTLREIPAGAPLSVAGLAPPELERTLVAQIVPLVRRRASELLGMSDVQRLLDRLERTSPGVVRQVVPGRVGVPVLTEVLRRLIDEQLNVRDLACVLEAIAATPPHVTDALELAESVRGRFSQRLTYELTGGSGSLPVIVLDRMIEDEIEAAITTTSAGRFLSLAPAAARDIAQAIERAATAHPDTVLLTRPEVRRFVRKLAESHTPELRVVAFTELTPDVALETRATVTVRGA